MSPLDQIEALEAIDATLAGAPVDPRFADMAELALLLRDERPRPPAAFTASLDDRVRHRFGRPAPAARLRLPRLSWLFGPAAGVVAAVAVAIVIVVSQGTPSHSSSVAASSAPHRAPSSAEAIKHAPATLDSLRAGALRPAHLPQAYVPQVAATSAVPLAPPANGRRIVQSAQLELATRASQVEQVSQEVFQTAGRYDAIVRNSTVTAGNPAGSAEFELSIPSAQLSQAMAALSTLPYAHVASRTDATQDVNDQYLADRRRLTEARALRTSLLKQLAAATTTAQINSLTAQIHDADASISSDEATLRGLSSQIDYSQVTVTINSAPVPLPLAHHSSGFTLGRAAHDAGRVLTVAAGVVLIGLAAALPLSLLAALGWWVWAATRRRRREHALDTV